MMQIGGRMIQNGHQKCVMVQIGGRMTQNGHQKWGNDADWLSDDTEWTPKVG